MADTIQKLHLPFESLETHPAFLRRYRLIAEKGVLGLGGDAAPDKAPGNKQRKARLEALMDACLQWF